MLVLFQENLEIPSTNYSVATGITSLIKANLGNSDGPKARRVFEPWICELIMQVAALLFRSRSTSSLPGRSCQGFFRRERVSVDVNYRGDQFQSDPIPVQFNEIDYFSFSFFHYLMLSLLKLELCSLLLF